jgi:Phage terminase large subunit (GpA).
MLNRGEWRPVRTERDSSNKNIWVEEKEPRSKPESIAYNLNSIYSPWVTFGQVAQKFLRSKDDPISFMNFMNGWLALPWEPSAATMNSNAVMKLQRPYERMTVPKEGRDPYMWHRCPA